MDPDADIVFENENEEHHNGSSVLAEVTMSDDNVCFFTALVIALTSLSFQTTSPHISPTNKGKSRIY